MGKYKLEFNAECWECGDGCCDGNNTQVIINGIEIGWYADVSYSEFEGIEKFISELNICDVNLDLIYTIELDKVGDIQAAIYLNNSKITDSMHVTEVYGDILTGLKLEHKIISYDLDWDVWLNEKIIVLEVEEN